MEDFVAYIIKNLVSQPSAVVVTSHDETDFIRIEINVAPEDVGKVIGRKGNTINALRTIVRTVATRLGRKAQVELIQQGQPAKVLVEESAPECEETIQEECSQEECSQEELEHEVALT